MVLLGAIFALVWSLVGGSFAPAEDPPERLARIVVIVHPDNPIKNLSLKELRSWLLLDRQFWPNRTRVILLRRPTSSTEEQVLADKVYGLRLAKLKTYWPRRLYAGEIPAIPAIIRKGRSAVRAVSRNPRAISVVLASEDLQGVRVLTIDSKTPSESNYPLVVDKAR